MSHTEALDSLRRQLRNARQRARYWSGNPSGRGFGFSPRATATSDADAEYEMAMDDCAALADEIHRITGTRPHIPDPKQDFKDAFASTVLPKLARPAD